MPPYPGDVPHPEKSGIFLYLNTGKKSLTLEPAQPSGAAIFRRLLSRAADVVLKERRRLVLVVRETPLHHGHLRSMLAATENGAIIMPPVPAFYHRPESVADIIDQTVGRCLDLFEIDSGLVKPWLSPCGE